MRGYLGLGANLGDPASTLARAMEALRAPDLVVLRRARLYRTPPLGPPGQPPYVNSALEIETDLLPEAVLARAKAVEAGFGRTKGERWGARVLDVDVLILGALRVDTTHLVIPHPELANRAFVLAPLVDLDPELVPPGLDADVATLLRRLDVPPEDLHVLDDRVLAVT